MLPDLDRAIDRNAERAFTFLERLVRAPSLLGREHDAMDVFAEEAARIGLTPVRLPFANGPLTDPRAGVAPAADSVRDGRFQVLATTTGDGPLRLLLNGHLDVVPAEAAKTWTSPPYVPTRRDGRLYGRGAGDMKSGFAVGMLALESLRDIAPDLFNKARLGFLAVIEEECTGNGTLRSIVENGVIADEVVVLEPTDLGLLLGGVGVLWADVTMFTHAGHVEHGADLSSAIDLGMQLVDRLRQWTSGLAEAFPEPTIADDVPYFVNLGMIEGGAWRSSMPASARMGIRIGFPRGWTADQCEAELLRRIDDFARERKLAHPPEVKLTGFRAHGYMLSAEHRLARGLAAAHRAAHGTDPVAFALASTADARIYVEGFGMPAICYGAVAHGIHGVDESVDLRSIVDAARTLARFIYARFTEEDAA